MTAEPAESTSARTPTGVELFTHPTCIGCQEALTALRRLEQDGRVSLAVTSLGVTSVPTVRVGDDHRVLLKKSDLDDLLAELTS